jgi:hypothetical protein
LILLYMNSFCNRYGICSLSISFKVVTIEKISSLNISFQSQYIAIEPMGTLSSAVHAEHDVRDADQ